MKSNFGFDISRNIFSLKYIILNGKKMGNKKNLSKPYICTFLMNECTSLRTSFIYHKQNLYVAWLIKRKINRIKVP